MSTGLSQAIASALDKKYVPSFQPGDIKDLGQHLGLKIPFSCLDVIRKLEGLPAQQILFPSGTLSPSTVTGWAQLGVASDGSVSFRTHIQENGAVGHRYAIGLVLTGVRDSAGNALAFVQKGKVAGSLDLGKHDDDEDQDGFSQVIAENWDAVKASGTYSDLKVTTDPAQVIETVLVGAFVVAVGVTVALFAGSKDTHCSWSAEVSGNAGGLQAEAVITWSSQ